MGHLLALVVTPANEQDRAQVAGAATALQEAIGETVELAYVDQGYPGDEPAAAAQAHGCEPAHTVAFVDDYCVRYRSVFQQVRHFEQFTQLELGLLAETKRKSLPRLAQTAKADHQALHHFLANAAWSVDDLRAIRLRLTHDALAGRPCILCIDETGDRKKGKTTDYVASQYIGNLHTIANGMVSVNA